MIAIENFICAEVQVSVKSGTCRAALFDSSSVTAREEQQNRMNAIMLSRQVMVNRLEKRGGYFVVICVASRQKKNGDDYNNNILKKKMKGKCKERKQE